jgi:ribosome recycling factor
VSEIDDALQRARAELAQTRKALEAARGDAVEKLRKQLAESTQQAEAQEEKCRSADAALQPLRDAVKLLGQQTKA